MPRISESTPIYFHVLREDVTLDYSLPFLFQIKLAIIIYYPLCSGSGLLRTPEWV